jgi:endonuclease/exonuclease/phosphatase family metal-dependent hydrolase
LLWWDYALEHFLENLYDIHLLNVYGPHNDRVTFWNRLVFRGILATKNLVIAGDLNLTTGADDIWGLAAHLDRQANFFMDLFKDNLLVDVASNILVLTWRNGRVGDAYIAKQLDRILIAEDLLSVVGRFHSWVELPFISDHSPVVVQLNFTQTRVAFPFKINPSWLGELDFK